MRPKTVGEENPSNLPAGYTLDLVGDPWYPTPPGRWVGWALYSERRPRR